MSFNPKDLPPKYQEQIREQICAVPKGTHPARPLEAQTDGAGKSGNGRGNFTKLVIQPSTDESKLNKTEAAYLARLRSMSLPIIHIQSLTLKLGDDCRYTPDFVVIEDFRPVAHEVKGFWRDDAKVKIKVAARLFPWIVFKVAMLNKGQWTVEDIKV